MIREVKSVEGFDRWFYNARSGDRVAYYAGFLIRDRIELLAKKTTLTPEIQTAVRAWKFHERAQVELFQKRLGPGQYVYLAYKI